MILRSTKGSALTYDEMDNNLVYLDTTKVSKTETETIAGTKTFSSPIIGNLTGNATTSTRLFTPRKINGVTFDGTSDITLPAQTLSGVTITDFAQTFKGAKTFSDGLVTDISGNAGTANALKVGRKINGVVFDGTTDIQLPTADQTNFCTLSTAQSISGVKTFSVSPLAPTPTTNDNSTKVATTAFVKAVTSGLSAGSGASGPQGPQGPSGPQGPQGPAGGMGWLVTYGTLTLNSLQSGVGQGPSSSQNYADVYPPSGYSMGNLVGFIPSMKQTNFAGGVDANDSIYCYYTVFGDKIRIQSGNTEQRALGTVNYLAIWAK
jgi:hypothetical protein